MTNYYDKQLQLPVEEFKLKPELNSIVLQVIANEVKTHHLTINLESIPSIRAMLDIIEKIQIEQTIKDIHYRLREEIKQLEKGNE